MANELTLYFWPSANRHYPNGHAAFRVRIGSQELLLNYDDEEDLDPEKRRVLNARARLKAQKRTEEEQRTLIKTAVLKLKIPLLGCENAFGLPLKDLGEYLHLRTRTLLNGSIFGVSDILYYAGAEIYSQPCIDYRYVNQVQLLMWARALHTRLEELNGMAKSLEEAITRNATASSYRTQVHGRSILDAQKWKELSNKDTGLSLVRSEGVRKMDKLISRYHQEPDRSARTRILADLVETIYDYIRSRGQQSDRSSSVLVLAKNVISFMRAGGPGSYAYSGLVMSQF